MDQSIENAEKLVHSTMAALAQMKHDILVEDLSRRSDIKFNSREKPRVPTADDDVEEIENELQVETKEIFKQMDELLDPRRYAWARKVRSPSKSLEKIQEINKKIEDRKRTLLRRQKSAEIGLEISKQKNLNRIQFIESNEADAKTESGKSFQLSVPSSCETEQPIRAGSKPKAADVTIDLKSKILETEEIVDRGIQTARQLKQKVDYLASAERKVGKMTNYEKALSGDLSASRISDRISTRTVSTETIKSLDSRKHKKHDETKKEKRKKKNRLRPEENVSVVEIKRTESKKIENRKLRLQQLPSMHIRDGLQCQKIPSVDILPQSSSNVVSKVNAAIKTFSHDEIEQDRINKVLQEIRNSSECFCSKKDNRLIECFHCGKPIHVPRTMVDSRELDQLLLECNFNVFDPRIDEYVEKQGRIEVVEGFDTVRGVPTEGFINNKCLQPSENVKEQSTSKVHSDYQQSSKTLTNFMEVDKRKQEKPLTILQLSKAVSNKYKEDAKKIEFDHLKFENMLRRVFKKADESRDIFEGALSRSESYRGEKLLERTKPLIVNLTDFSEGKIIKEGSLENKSTNGKHLINETNLARARGTREKKEIKTSKRILRSSPKKAGSKETLKKDVDFLKKIIPESEKELPLKEPLAEKPSVLDKTNARASKQIKEIPTVSPASKNPSPEENIAPKVRLNSDSEQSSSESDRALKIEEYSKASLEEVEIKTDDDYESDFELESLGRDISSKSEKSDIEILENNIEEERNLRRQFYKLSTISEADSDIEKKPSESTTTGQDLLHETQSEKFHDFVQPEERESNQTSSKRNPGESQIELHNNGIKDVLNEAFEKGIVYTITQQRDILNLSYKSKKENSLAKKRENVKTPAVELSDSGSSSEGVIGLTSKMKQDVSEILSQSSKELTTARSNLQKIVKNVSKHSSLEKLTSTPRSEMKSVHANKTEAASQNETSKEMVSVLKEVLGAIKNQFAKTEQLAERLTENIKETNIVVEEKKCEKIKENEGHFVGSWQVLADPKYVKDSIFNNLQRARKINGSKESENLVLLSPNHLSSTLGSFTEEFAEKKSTTLSGKKKVVEKNELKAESKMVTLSGLLLKEAEPVESLVRHPLKGKIGGKSELIQADRKRKGRRGSSDDSSSTSDSRTQPSSRKKSSRLSSGQDIKDNGSKPVSPLVWSGSCSEGEIPSGGHSDAKHSNSQSIGEVVSEPISSASTGEET